MQLKIPIAPRYRFLKSRSLTIIIIICILIFHEILSQLQEQNEIISNGLNGDNQTMSIIRSINHLKKAKKQSTKKEPRKKFLLKNETPCKSRRKNKSLILTKNGKMNCELKCRDEGKRVQEIVNKELKVLNEKLHIEDFSMEISKKNEWIYNGVCVIDSSHFRCKCSYENLVKLQPDFLYRKKTELEQNYMPVHIMGSQKIRRKKNLYRKIIVNAVIRLYVLAAVIVQSGSELSRQIQKFNPLLLENPIKKLGQKISYLGKNIFHKKKEPPLTITDYVSN